MRSKSIFSHKPKHAILSIRDSRKDAKYVEFPLFNNENQRFINYFSSFLCNGRLDRFFRCTTHIVLKRAIFTT